MIAREPTPSHLANGVKNRRDGKGDGWATAHRTLGTEFLMQDCDGLFGQLTFATQTADKLFLEYVPDGFENRLETKRNFAVVALFDRKRSLPLALHESNLMSMHFYTWLCRSLSVSQPEPVRFFIVSEPDPGPWRMTEIDCESRETKQSVVVYSNQMKEVWEELGLMSSRQRLKRWIQNPSRSG